MINGQMVYRLTVTGILQALSKERDNSLAHDKGGNGDEKDFWDIDVGLSLGFWHETMGHGSEPSSVAGQYVQRCLFKWGDLRHHFRALERRFEKGHEDLHLGSEGSAGLG